MKYITVFLIIIIVSCNKKERKLDIYFNSASLVTKDFNIVIESNNNVLFDTTLNRTTVATYRNIANIDINNGGIYKIKVNGIDSLINIDAKYSKLFIGYQEEFHFPERTDRASNQDESALTFDKKYHMLQLKLKK